MCLTVQWGHKIAKSLTVMKGGGSQENQTNRDSAKYCSYKIDFSLVEMLIYIRSGLSFKWDHWNKLQFKVTIWKKVELNPLQRQRQGATLFINSVYYQTVPVSSLQFCPAM